MEKREIKFRGLYKGVWVYGNLIQGIVEGTPFSQIEQSDSNDYQQWAVDPESVGQFVGLRDRNGVDVYEGDVIQTDYDGRYVIEFEHGCFVASSIGKVPGSSNVEAKYRVAFGIGEVIGNLYEHPHLLDQKAEAA